MKTISCLAAFAAAFCIFTFPAFAQETSADIFEPVVDAQNKILEDYDVEAMEEENRLSEKRTDEQNDMIEEAEINFRDAAASLAEKTSDDTALFLENIEQVENSKKAILNLRNVKSQNSSAVEYAALVNLDKSYKVLEN
ncbi:MAG: hypothetical protein II077_03980, partial [Treponema sp.]|nr:hypothetical protein [Treponema sp.]